jgi:hypothetical protein
MDYEQMISTHSGIASLWFKAGFVVECAPFFDFFQDGFGAVFPAFFWVEDDV